MSLFDTLLTPVEAADLLGLTPRFLERRRYVGDGPPFIRISARCVRYRSSDLREWIESDVRSSTADNGHK
jgi:predicted DNA-binding transcriptional regulator AlpA